jgi:hypothetical protein
LEEVEVLEDVEGVELFLVLEQLHGDRLALGRVDDAVAADGHVVVLVDQPVGHDLVVVELAREAGRLRELELEGGVRLQLVDEVHYAYQVGAFLELVAVDDVFAFVFAGVGE